MRTTSTSITQLFSSLTRRRRRSAQRRISPSVIESLEPREMLTTFVVDNLGDENDRNFEQGEQTLREAVDRANVNPGFDTIVFSESLFPSPDSPQNLVNLTVTSPLNINDDTEIIGAGASRLRLLDDSTQVDNRNHIFSVAKTANVTISDVAFNSQGSPGTLGAGVIRRTAGEKLPVFLLADVVGIDDPSWKNDFEFSPSQRPWKVSWMSCW